MYKRFIDNKDRTVTDSYTRLMWAENANIAGGKMTWRDVVLYCTKLVLAGYSDWRLPNIKELISIVDYRRSNPALLECKLFSKVILDWYWSSDIYTAGSDFSYDPNIRERDAVWVIDLSTGALGYTGINGTSYMWPVRTRNYRDDTGV